MGKIIMKIFLTLLGLGMLLYLLPYAWILCVDLVYSGHLFVPEEIQGRAAQEEKVHRSPGNFIPAVPVYIRLRPGIRS